MLRTGVSLRPIAWFPLVVLVVALGARADTPLILTVDGSLQGEESGDSAGVASSMGGDLDGDGLDDLLLGAPNHDGAFTQGGKVYLVFGAPVGPHSLGNTVASYSGLQNHDYAGMAVAIAPDLNGDGLDDALIGAPGADAGGIAYVVFGRTAGWTTETPLTEADAWFEAEDFHDGVGCSLAGLGDVDGDGIGDLLVGAWSNDHSALAGGAAYLVLGRQWGWTQGAPIAVVDASFHGENDGDHAGDEVAAAGDVDGDGLADLLVAAPTSDLGGVDSGAVYLVLGRAQGWTPGTSLASADAVFPGDGSLQGAGRAVAGAGDVNGDGLDDFLVSSAGVDDRGAISLFFGAPHGWAPDVTLADADVTYVGEDEAVLAGSGIAGGGDLNGDGFDDLVLGSDGHDGPGGVTGRGYVVLGQPHPGPPVVGLVASDAWVEGGGVHGVLGRAAAAGGDLDGDGWADLALVADGSGGEGEVLVVYGFPDEDADGDGVEMWAGDCDDGDPAVHPGAEDPCGDLVDADCGGDWWVEADADGDGFAPCGGDCDDTDPAVNPGQEEVCDELDNDCDGDRFPGELVDGDGDGHPLCADCADGNPWIHPGAAELCNGVDDDCDGSIPEGEMDGDGDGFLFCEDCDDENADFYPGAPDPCGDQLDTDCAGDLGWELDHDGDGVTPCDGDCHDNDPAVHPGAVEVCNDVDDDCDGLLPPAERDADQDGFAACEGDCDDQAPWIYPGASDVCGDLEDFACDGDVADEIDHDGDGFPPCAGDCDDADPSRHPAAPEVCDGIDNDCDDLISPQELRDLDGDGHLYCADCDDYDSGVHPGAEEVCDFVDNDCDGRIDEPDPDCWEAEVEPTGETDTGDPDASDCECGMGSRSGAETSVWITFSALVALLVRRRSGIPDGSR